MNSEQQIYTLAFIFSQILQKGQGGDSHTDKQKKTQWKETESKEWEYS